MLNNFECRVLKKLMNPVFYYMENIIKPTVDQNGGCSREVPIIYGSPERWKANSKRWIL